MPMIVLAGVDGTGKGKQFGMLLEYLASLGFEITPTNPDMYVYPDYPIVTPFDFPRYSNPACHAVKDYLIEQLWGPPNMVDPYFASATYAFDRFAAKPQLLAAVANNGIAVCNRYVDSNMAHQGQKIRDPQKRQLFFKWLDDYEFKMHGIPRPDINIIFTAPLEVCQMLIERKGKRKQLKGQKDNKDGHERDANHLVRALELYKEIAQLEGFTEITMMDDKGKLKTPEAIHAEVLSHVKPLLPAPVKV